jgi:hypothetical protein
MFQHVTTASPTCLWPCATTAQDDQAAAHTANIAPICRPTLVGPRSKTDLPASGDEGLLMELDARSGIRFNL